MNATTRRALWALVLCLAFPAVVSAATLPVGALVHAGDHLHVTVAGESALTQDVVVAEDGTIGLPLVGQVRVAGTTPEGASAAVAVALKPYIRDPKVTVDVATEGHITVTILGDVVNAGAYTLRPGATLSAAITAAGGMAPTIAGEYPVARIANPDGTVYHLSLDKLLREGDPTRDVTLQDRSAIYVPGPTQFDIVVLGAVDHPGTIPINEGDRLSIAIAKAGNSVNSKADLTRVAITRTEPNGTRATHPVNLYQALEKGDARFDPSLRAGDIVYVPIANKSSGNLTNAMFLIARLLFIL
jgi:protein involved in polysaccharide export with SLBB domain